MTSRVVNPCTGLKALPSGSGGSAVEEAVGPVSLSGSASTFTATWHHIPVLTDKPVLGTTQPVLQYNAWWWWAAQALAAQELQLCTYVHVAATSSSYAT